jgi:hypothetical protein
MGIASLHPSYTGWPWGAEESIFSFLAAVKEVEPNPAVRRIVLLDELRFNPLASIFG